MRTRTDKRAAAAALAVLLAAGACGGSAGDGDATPAAAEVPTPAAEQPTPTPEPARGSGPAAVPEPAPVEEPDPPAAAEERETATDPPEDPSAEAGPAASPGEELDEAAVAALAARLASVQSNVTSRRTIVSMSLAESLPGAPSIAIDDMPLMTITEQGDSAHAEMDAAGLAGGFLGAAGGGLEEQNLPPLEMITEGETGLYLRLEPLLALDPAGDLPWSEDQIAEHGGDLADLWGFVDLSDPAGAELWAYLGATPQAGAQEDFIDLLAQGPPAGALLEARSLGAGEVAGVATQAYGFVIDVAALAGEWPPILESLMGDLGQGGPTPEEFLGALPPLPAELVIEADSSGFVRGLELSLDLGAILMAVFAGFGEMGETPDGADIGLPEFEYLLSIRFETLAVNDPSLTVALPDPSLVVDLP